MGSPTSYEKVPPSNPPSSRTRKEYYGELARLVDAPVPVFDESQALVRGGNKRVVSEVRGSLDLAFEYDDVTKGLQNAVQTWI